MDTSQIQNIVLFWLKIVNIKRQRNPNNSKHFYNSALIITLRRLYDSSYTIININIINVLHFCFELRAEDDQ